jgi:hypothetical protein
MPRPKLSRFLVAATLMLLLFSGAPTTALAQCFPMTCNDPNQSGPATGQDIGGDNEVQGSGNPLDGPPGSSGSCTGDCTANPGGSSSPPGGSGRPGGSSQPGAAGVGQPGQSGRIVPPPPPPAARTTTTTKKATTTSRTSTSTSTSATPTPDPLLSPTPSPSPSPSPTPSESPSPTPTPSDLVAALNDADPAASDGSLVPFFSIVAGAILLFLYVRSRRPRRGMHSMSNRRGGSHSF